MRPSLVAAKRWVVDESALLEGGLTVGVQDMRMKFEAEDPKEVTDNKVADKVDRSQGAARAISVGLTPEGYLYF